ncbi:hypothetical protein PbJCM13498_18530 [Prolixibacter bellariivorans]|uniref:DUF6850 domain-containing protein n=2 Tax=Prolixibacter bellariivorans TaxID=314319 RepID=A0A5M4AYM9_9BACT|nr:hypothetical protein PbJCM13498_18530 [Prolixibacter bellariivorans]
MDEQALFLFGKPGTELPFSLILGDSLPDFNRLELSGTIRRQPFRETGTPDKFKGLNFSTYGYKQVKQLRFFGKFDYGHSTEDNIMWHDRLSSHPVNPFQLVDSIGGSWKKDQYHLQVHGLAPLTQHWAAGLGLNYRVESGGKDQNPRAGNNAFEITVTPSLTYRTGNWNLGIEGWYRGSREDIDFLTYQNNVGYDYFFINGLSLYGHPLNRINFSYRYDATGKGGTIFFQNKVSWGKRWTGKLGYKIWEESAIETPYASSLNQETGRLESNPETDAQYSLERFDGLVSFTLPGEKWNQHFSVAAQYNDGRNFMTQSAQTNLTTQYLNAQIDWKALLKEEMQVRWIFNASVNLLSGKTNNILYGYQKLETLTAHGSVFHSFFTGQKGRIETELAASWETDLGSTLNIAPASVFIPQTSEITGPVVRHNFRYLSAGDVKVFSQITWYPEWKPAPNAYIRLAGGANRFTAMEETNSFVEIGLGSYF